MVRKTPLRLLPGSWLTRFIPLRSRIQAMAWELANPHVMEYITIAVTKPDNQWHWIEPTFRGRISLADTIVLVHRLGFVHAGEIVAVVDPWQYPEEATTVVSGIKNCIQSAVDKATDAGRSFHKWTGESKTEYLVSPLLSRNRPCLVRIPRRRGPSPGPPSSCPCCLRPLPLP